MLALYGAFLQFEDQVIAEAYATGWVRCKAALSKAASAVLWRKLAPHQFDFLLLQEELEGTKVYCHVMPLMGAGGRKTIYAVCSPDASIRLPRSFLITVYNATAPSRSASDPAVKVPKPLPVVEARFKSVFRQMHTSKGDPMVIAKSEAAEATSAIGAASRAVGARGEAVAILDKRTADVSQSAAQFYHEARHFHRRQWLRNAACKVQLIALLVLLCTLPILTVVMFYLWSPYREWIESVVSDGGSDSEAVRLRALVYGCAGGAVTAILVFLAVQIIGRCCWWGLGCSTRRRRRGGYDRV